ncbi:MAG: LysM domain-containing protein [Pseudomonadota bacterium]
MHKSLFLILLGAVACDRAEAPRGPHPTTLAILQTEPVDAVPAVPRAPVPAGPAPVISGGSVEADALARVLPAPDAPADVPRGLEVEVRAGESLVLLARFSECSVEVLAEVNGLDPTEPLFPGQGLLLPSEDEHGDSAIRARRDAFAQARLDTWLERRGGLLALEEHRVRTGETAWGIARDARGIPSWVLAAYNPEVDLDRLTIGARLVVPVLGDTVADAEPEVRAPEEVVQVGEDDEEFIAAEDEVGAPLPAISDTVRMVPEAE